MKALVNLLLASSTIMSPKLYLRMFSLTPIKILLVIYPILYEKYNLEKILYMETTVILPEYRRLRVPDLLQDPVYGNYPNDGILAEGMLTVGSYLAGGLEQNKLIQSVRRGEMIYCKRVLSHDGFVVPVVFRPPLC
eukprot:TCONS_00003411-protein